MVVLALEAVRLSYFLLSKLLNAGPCRLVTRILVAGLLAGCLVHSAQAARHNPGVAHVMVKPVTVHFAHHASIVHRPVSALSMPTQRAKAKHANHTAQITPVIINALRAAQQKVSADPFMLLAIAWKESRFDPLARNKHSSARGLLQFTTATWLTVIRDFGPRHGLAHFASVIRTDRDGKLSVATPRLRQAILVLRDDPNLEVIMAAEQLTQQRIYLEAHLGRSATSADLYVLHLLGPDGAKNFLTQLAQKPDSSSVAVVGQAAKPNLGLFVRDGHVLSMAEAYAGIQTTIHEQTTLHAGLFNEQIL